MPATGTPLVPRSLVQLDPVLLPTEEVEILVVGSGVAGLSLALGLPRGQPVLLATKGPLIEGATRYAQGGIAAVLPGGADRAGKVDGVDVVDGVEAHLRDTLAAGVGLVDPAAARVLVEEAAEAIIGLLGHGARFDRDADAGGLARTREGGHSRARILHAGGDATGAEIERALVAAVRSAPNVRVAEGAYLVDLLTDGDGGVTGALLLLPGRWGTPATGRLIAVRAGAVVLASGGAGQLYAETTNPAAATGDGIAAALRAGAALADLEFVQFHPTALHVERDPRLLLTEALRGEGAILRDPRGDPVMIGVHPMGDLAPRDVVTRGMADRMAMLGTDHLLLDATALGARTLERRFPTIVAACRAAGLDPATTPLPVSPAAHYLMGGVRTDLDGRASIPGLFAVGEAACTGVHGANRLASNSLLEGVVFADRAARALAADRPRPPQRRRWAEPLATSSASTVPAFTTAHPPEPTDGQAKAGRTDGPSTAGYTATGRRAAGQRARLRLAMTRGAGVLRSRAGLAGTISALTSHAAPPAAADRASFETANLAQLGLVLAVLAARREESRGAHWRADAPATSPAWRVRQAARRLPDGTLTVDAMPVETMPAGSVSAGAVPATTVAADTVAAGTVVGLWTARPRESGDVAMSAVGGPTRDHGE